VKPETPQEKRAHELACLREIERQIDEAPSVKAEGSIIHDLRLEGAFSETCIVLEAERFSKRQLTRWKLWDEANGDFGTDPAGEAPDPAWVAREVMVFLHEF
jgi:hypothetical protein